MSDLLQRQEAIYAEIGRLTMAASSVDNSLTVSLSRLMSGEQASFDTSLASIFVFAARSIDQRFEIVRKVFRWRLSGALAMPKHTNERRAVDFAEKALNIIEQNIRSHRWTRNTAAHGSILNHQNDTFLTPAMMDREGWSALRSRGEGYEFGLSLKHLSAATAEAQADNAALAKLNHVLWSILEWKTDPSELLERANALAQDLKIPSLSLKDPREGPPMRQRRQRRDEKRPTR